MLPKASWFFLWLMISVMVPAGLFSACGSDPEIALVNQAESELEAGRFQQAEEIHRRYLQEFPEGKHREQVLFELGQILYFTLSKKQESIGVFEELLKYHPQSSYAFKTREILSDLYYWGSQNYGLALIEYQRMLAEKPDYSKAPYFKIQVARCLIRTGRSDEAKNQLERLIHDYPKSDVVQTAYDELAGIYRAAGKNDEALSIYRLMLSRFPKSERKTDFEFKMGLVLEELARDEEALVLYRGLLNRYENRRVVEIRIEAINARRKKK